MQKRFQESTAIGRPLNPRYFTNVLILILTPVGGIIAGVERLIATGDLGTAALAGLYTAAAVFFAWALAREVDPDYDYSAFVAALLALIAMVVFTYPPLALIAQLVLLNLLRLVNRTVGPPAQLADSIVTLVLVAAAIFIDSWLIGVVAAAAFLLDALLRPPLTRHYLFAALAVALTATGIAVNGPGEQVLPATINLVAMAVTGVLFAVTILVTRKLHTPADRPGYTLYPRRIQAAMALFLLAGVITGLWGGNTALLAWLPVWTTLLSVPVYRLIATIIGIQPAQNGSTLDEQATTG